MLKSTDSNVDALQAIANQFMVKQIYSISFTLNKKHIVDYKDLIDLVLKNMFTCI